MVNGNGIDESFNDRLRQAESAEREVQRLEPLAAEAPQLRLQKAKAQKEEEPSRPKMSLSTKLKTRSKQPPTSRTGCRICWDKPPARLLSSTLS
jgi:hypothetical protein